MEELYEAIEEKIRTAGYHGSVDGEEIYNEICDQIEDQEPGAYVFMSKKTESVFFEYKIDLYDDEFNLSYMDIHDNGQVIHVDFDSE